MTWLTVPLYFALWALAWPALLAGYANALLAAARAPGPLRVLLGLLAYLAFAMVIFLPFLALFEYGPWRTMMRERDWFVPWFVACFLLSLIPGVSSFRRRYLGQLKRVGYFKSR